MGLRVITKDNRLGFAYTSDFEPASLDASWTGRCSWRRRRRRTSSTGCRRRRSWASSGTTGELYDPAVAELAGDWKIKAALEMEKAGKAVDPRIATFDSVGAGDYVSEVYVASSEGLSAGYAGTYVYLYASPVASENGQLQTSYWMDYKRFLGDLDSPEESAARRRGGRCGCWAPAGEEPAGAGDLRPDDGGVVRGQRGGGGGRERHLQELEHLRAASWASGWRRSP